jgi:hypothetical protein
MPEEVKDVQPDSSPADQDQGTEPKDSKEQHVPFSRFKAVNDELREARQALAWVQQNVESPQELIELLELKKQKAQEKAGRSGNGKLTEEQRAAVREVFKESVPTFEKIEKLIESGVLEEKLKESELSEDDLINDTHDEILKIVNERKMPTTDAFLSRLGSQIMMEITQDEKLHRKWQRGDTSTVRLAWERLEKDFYGQFKGQASKDLQTRKTIARLPTLPQGGTAVTEKPKSKGEPQGITKDVHKAAWDYLKSVSEE